MFRKVKLDNNIPVLLESVREVHSVCIGIWVKIGSRHEAMEKNGISHFLEHMFFKGTESKSAEDIAMEIDSLGGELNAFTSSEYTLFYVKVLDEFIDRALGLITDIFLHSTLPETEIEKEKNIIIEEVKMVEDNPSDYVHDLFGKNIWGSKGLGQPILGRLETIHSFTRDDLVNHINNHYGIDNVIVACSGNFDENALINSLNASIGRLMRPGEQKDNALPKFSNDINITTKDLSEAHICLGLKGISYNNKDRYAMHLLNTVLGSGFSSRLFQNIREKRGLVYSIYSYHVAYIDTGLWAVYAGSDKKNVSEIVNITVDEMNAISTNITDEELERAKSQLKGNLILALESTSNKMTNIAKQEIYYKKYHSPKEVIQMVDAVTLEKVKDIAADLVDGNRFALTLYGPVGESDLKGTCKLLQ
jgi:predicted Zn-dependent peptidase